MLDPVKGITTTEREELFKVEDHAVLAWKNVHTMAVTF